LPANDYAIGQSRVVKINKEHSLMYLALDKEEIDKCLNSYTNCPTELQYYSKVIWDFFSFYLIIKLMIIIRINNHFIKIFKINLLKLYINLTFLFFFFVLFYDLKR